MNHNFYDRLFNIADAYQNRFSEYYQQSHPVEDISCNELFDKVDLILDNILYEYDPEIKRSNILFWKIRDLVEDYLILNESIK